MSGSEKENNIPTYLPTQKNLSRRMANKQFFNLGPTSCPFGYVLISDQLQYNVNNLYIVLFFFLNIPIPCYIFHKTFELICIWGGYLRIIPCFT
jgi:hypothetical protein